MKEALPTFADVKQAAERIAPFAKHTPIFTSTNLNKILGAELYFKCENFQKVGAFKFRGACNAVFALSDDEAHRGVATHSSGNHAAALSLAARLRGIPAYIVMPRTAPRVKKEAVKGYGGRITFCEPTLQAREATLKTIVEKTGAKFIHPSNDAQVIAGQGTIAVEMISELDQLDMVMAPVGGGGLISGTGLSVHSLSLKTRVIGVEPEKADDAYRSLKAGRIILPENPDTIADGLRTALGSLTFPMVQKYVHEIVTVSEEGIVAAMRLVWERMKIIIEPSSAVPVAALLEKKIAAAGRRIGIILSGGNVDLDHLPW